MGDHQVVVVGRGVHKERDPSLLWCVNNAVETGAKHLVRRTGQQVIRQVRIAFTADLMPA